mgnify:FL=1
MNVSYRIVKVDPYEHGILVRYFTDKVTENDLATSFNPDGSIKLHADGYPLSTRTDVFMSIYDVPPPNFDDLDKTIKARAPIDWLQIQENIADANVDTSLSNLRNRVGDTASFVYNTSSNNAAPTVQEVNLGLGTQSTPVPDQPMVSLDEMAGQKEMFQAFVNNIISVINSGNTIPLIK